MKKTISIVLFAAAFGLVGCSAQKNPDRTAERDYTIASADARPKCPAGKCPTGKLGDRMRAEDTAK